MPDRKRIPLMSVAAIAVGCILIAITAYVSAYFWLGNAMSTDLPGEWRATDRVYRNPWMARLFSPMGKLEAMLTRRHVFLDNRDEPRELRFDP